MAKQLWKSFISEDAPSASDPCFDLLSAAHALRKRSLIRWTTHHVKGHQDKDTPIEGLDRWVKLNILMDKKAKALLKHHPQCPQQFAIPFEPWSIWYQGKKLSKARYTTIYIVHAPAALSY
jgi:hypothetical protein